VEAPGDSGLMSGGSGTGMVDCREWAPVRGPATETGEAPMPFDEASDFNGRARRVLRESSRLAADAAVQARELDAGAHERRIRAGELRTRVEALLKRSVPALSLA
jgi:hypothetical protein